jgi:hypothetical protein
MQITINIDPNLPRWLKRVAMYAGVPASLVVASVAYAQLDAPTFGAGDKLSATAMNGAFKTLTDAINGMAGQLAAHDTAISDLKKNADALAANAQSNINAAALAAQCRSSGGHFLTQAAAGKRCDVVCAGQGPCSGNAPATCRSGWKAFGTWGGAIYSYGDECTTAAASPGNWCCCNFNGCVQQVFVPAP